MTTRLYYDDCYLASFDAECIAAEGTRAYLDRSAFYPESGGQPHDIGSINGISVLDVVDEGERVAHVTSAPLTPGPVSCSIDWQRRFDHMQQHTGQHLLSAVFEHEFGWKTLSFHMGADISTIELSTSQIPQEALERVTLLANDYVRRNVPVTITYSESVEGLRKPSKREGELRIISIEGLDRSACGGTHVRSTAELGPILLRGTEKIRGNTRVELACGTRALLRAQQDFRIVSALVKIASVRPENLETHFSALNARLSDAEKSRQRLATELARIEGRELHGQTEADGDGLRRVVLRVTAVDDFTRTKLQAFTGLGKAVALAVAGNTVALSCSADSGLNAAALLKSSGARGGGSATMAQGAAGDPEALVAAIHAPAPLQ